MMHRMMSSLLCGVLLAAMLSGLSAWAAGEVEYTIDALDMSVSIPSDYTVFTRETDAGDPALREYGLTKDKLLSMMEDYKVYLIGRNAGKNQELHIMMNGETELDDFHLCDRTMLYTFASEIASMYTEDPEASLVKKDFYESSQAKFVRTFYSRQGQDTTNYTIAYDTVYGGKFYTITLISYGEPILVSDEAKIEGIVGSIVFDATSPAVPRFTPTAAYQYTDAETKTTFTVPANWTENQLDGADEPEDYTQVIFKSLEDSGVHIAYTCIDVWRDLPASTRFWHNRSDVDNSFFSKEDIAKEHGITAEKIQSVLYGENEFFRIPVTSGGSSGYTTTEMRYYNNGYLHSFLFTEERFSDYKYQADFESLLSSTEFQSKGSPAGALPLGLSPGGILLGILVALLLYALPVVLYRYAVRKSPVEKKKARKFTIAYAGCAVAVVALLVVITSGKAIGASVVLLWSVVNYFMLVCGKKPESRAEEVSLEQAEPALCTGESLDAPAPDEASAAAPIPIGSAESAAEPVPDECGSEPEPEEIQK